jgi:hypothetical protein
MPDDAAIATSLSHIGNHAPAYVHRDKVLTLREPLALSSSMLKWYDLARADLPVPAEIGALARGYLAREDAAGRLGALGGALGFVILHRCSEAFYFLIVSTWRNENEIWETVYAKAKADDPDFALFPLPGPHRGTYCVWELGAVWHERQAWRRFLLTARDDTAKRAYLGDHIEGSV